MRASIRTTYSYVIDWVLLDINNNNIIYLTRCIYFFFSFLEHQHLSMIKQKKNRIKNGTASLRHNNLLKSNAKRNCFFILHRWQFTERSCSSIIWKPPPTSNAILTDFLVVQWFILTTYYWFTWWQLDHLITLILLPQILLNHFSSPLCRFKINSIRKK